MHLAFLFGAPGLPEMIIASIIVLMLFNPGRWTYSVGRKICAVQVHLGRREETPHWKLIVVGLVALFCMSVYFFFRA